VKLHWIFTGLAASTAILATGFVLSSRESSSVAAAMPTAPGGVTVRAMTHARPAENTFAERFNAVSFADRFAGAPVWETSYVATRDETRTTSYASLQAPAAAQRATDAVASRAPGFELASASATVAIPSGPRSRSIEPEPRARSTDSEPRARPNDIASAVASFSEPDSRIAIYDIAAHTVYMPNGDRLEAHSGLGERLDNPRFVNVKMKGPTPPNVYKLSMRERVFHGVRAIRLTPVDESKMFGRDGMLAHTYMLRNRGHSNGCVVFSNYPAFLAAFQRGEVDRLVVVDRLDKPPRASAKIASAN
jgi:hypothetical protein